jgi:hypothetical protein
MGYFTTSQLMALVRQLDVVRARLVRAMEFETDFEYEPDFELFAEEGTAMLMIGVPLPPSATRSSVEGGDTP